MEKWSNVPISTSYTLEKVALKDLPTLLGRSISLDKRVANILTQTAEKSEVYWLFNDDLITIAQFPKLQLDCDEIEVEVDGKSTGYYDSGICSGPPENCYPPEGDDERTITGINLIFYKNGKELSQYRLKEIELSDFEALKIKLVQRLFSRAVWRDASMYPPFWNKSGWLLQ